MDIVVLFSVRRNKILLQDELVEEMAYSEKKRRRKRKEFGERGERGGAGWCHGEGEAKG